ncbi:hypothetical protein [Actinomycetospora sp. TBRC 11914]|uniref:hypothetical protein n=1 Tax=Actinomycetospora sp. TBRC 11914 TaxID=2729387 RepID=UPI00145D6E54|nr:hypothetical protein [Actinomycetospora sp. TBRC 11914]NMO92421.1 hypothetical protein [Actinomycetospora sp. TBRC 11914]
MDLIDTFVRADQGIADAVARVGDAWSATLPPVFATDPPAREVHDAVAHLARDEAWIPALLAGRTLADVGTDAFDGHLLGDDPAAAFGRLAVRAQEAARGIPDLGAPVHCSFGDCSTEEYLWQLVVARTLGAEALTAAVGTARVVDDALAAAVLTGLAPRAELWRSVGILRPAVAPAGPAPRDELLALAGGTVTVECPT